MPSTPGLGTKGAQANASLGATALDPHPCMASVLKPQCTQQEQEHYEWLLQQIRWFVREELASHKASVEAMLRKPLLVDARQVADAMAPGVQATLKEQHKEFSERFEASVVSLQRQEESLGQSLERLLQQLSTMGALSGSPPPRPAFTYPRHGDADRELFEDLMAKVQSAQREQSEEIRKLADKLGTFRGGGARLQVADASPEVEGKPTTPQLTSARETVDPERLHSRQTVMKALRRAMCGGSASVQMVREFMFSALVLLNCLWMGIEGDMMMEAAYADTTPASWTTMVDGGFAACFALELFVRGALQGFAFFTCPRVRMNLFDSVVVTGMVANVASSESHGTWTRPFRVLRLFSAVRVVRLAAHVRELRILVRSIMGSVLFLVWVMAFLSFLLFLSSIFTMELVIVHVAKVGSAANPGLIKLYGSVGNCILSYFMLLTGGVPWHQLISPLREISVVFVFIFAVFVVFFVCGVMNIVTAMFVESTRTVAREDREAEAKHLVATSGSSLDRVRQCFRDGDGLIHEDALDIQLEQPSFRRLLRSLGLKAGEARALFQLLDTDSRGKVPIDDFLLGVVRMKNKDQPVDLAVVLYENKRVMTRLLAFMRFSEAHFRQIQDFLGMSDADKRHARKIDEYVEDCMRSSPVDPSRRDPSTAIHLSDVL